MSTTKRFLVTFSGEEPSMSILSEKRVSDLFDFSDCYYEPFCVFYLEENGSLSPVTLGKQERINSEEECPVIWATTPLIADSKVVGFVRHSDH